MAYSKNANLLLNVVNVNYYTLIQKSKVLYTGNLGTYSRKSCVPFYWLSSTAQQSVIMVVLKSFFYLRMTTGANSRQKIRIILWLCPKSSLPNEIHT